MVYKYTKITLKLNETALSVVCIIIYNKGGNLSRNAIWLTNTEIFTKTILHISNCLATS